MLSDEEPRQKFDMTASRCRNRPASTVCLIETETCSTRCAGWPHGVREALPSRSVILLKNREQAALRSQNFWPTLRSTNIDAIRKPFGQNREGRVEITGWDRMMAKGSRQRVVGTPVSPDQSAGSSPTEGDPMYIPR